jgi:menaquinone-dependent protoporphyrinogen oxidase
MTAEAPASADRPQNARVLVSAASRHGATAEIAQAIGHVLSRQGLDTTVMAPGDVDAIDDYDAVVIGSAVYVGHWLDPAKDLVNRFRTALAGRPVWLWPGR